MRGVDFVFTVGFTVCPASKVSRQKLFQPTGACTAIDNWYASQSYRLDRVRKYLRRRDSLEASDGIRSGAKPGLEDSCSVSAWRYPDAAGGRHTACYCW